MISCVEIQTEGANGGLSQASHQFFLSYDSMALRNHKLHKLLSGN